MSSHIIKQQTSVRLFDSVYARDIDGNVTFITDTLDSTQNLAFGYDLFGRITDSLGPYGNINFTYDAVGNRTTSALNGVSRNYSYSDNKLSSVSGDINRNFFYNAEGKLISDGDINLDYDKNNRIKTITIYGDEKIFYDYDLYGAGSIMKCNTWESGKENAILSGYVKTIHSFKYI